ncbi:hypothetical protein GUJ93_ZPchr0007g4428 [Zizania palustris]|uniref:DUF7597 domain-containing protein n=1 Tax=Zizania palustris TaxID=103762 RepID=A0A8J5VXT3_ZIZPA|nr:hypothetical protein GUJ93_ZPchr0007g4428 [Zizania palustris]
MISDGGGELRKPRNVITLSGQQIKKHEDMVILICGDNLDAMERQEFLHQVHDYITQGSDSMARNEDGLQLPPQPTIQDFAQATSAEHVTVDKLSAAEPGSSHTVAAPQND